MFLKLLFYQLVLSWVKKLCIAAPFVVVTKLCITAMHDRQFKGMWFRLNA